MWQSRAQNLLEAVNEMVGFHGPLTTKQLEELLDARRKSARFDTIGCPHIKVSATRFAKAHSVYDLFPRLAKQTVYYLRGQDVELGLLVGRESLDIAEEDRVGRRAFTRVISNMLDQIPRAYFAARAHYARETAGGFKFVDDPRAAGLVTPLNKWSEFAQYIFARVDASKRQRAWGPELNQLKSALLNPRYVPDYETLAATLGWQNDFTEEYRRLAAQAGKPLRVYVLGRTEIGYWGRLFDFGKPAMVS